MYDCANDCAARLTLVDCFDNALRLEIEERLPDDPTFHILWMMLVQIIQSDSMGKFTQMTNKIKQQTPQMYAGQNIAEMALAICTRATALSTAGFYDLQLNGMILKAFLLADGNDEYWFELMKTQSQLTATLMQVRFTADNHAASAFLTNLGLGHTQLCALAEGKYCEAVGDGIWPPATNTKDSKVTPSGYYTAAQLNALVGRNTQVRHNYTTPHKTQMIDTTINLLVNRTECTNLPCTTLTLRLAVKSDNSSPAILFRDSEKLDATIKLSLTLPTHSCRCPHGRTKSGFTHNSFPKFHKLRSL